MIFNVNISLRFVTKLFCCFGICVLIGISRKYRVLYRCSVELFPSVFLGITM